MTWLFIALFLVALYLLICGYIKSNHLFEKYVMFYGPILAIKTDNVKFFDKFIPYSRFFRIYGTLGAVMVAVVSIVMTVLLLFTLVKSIQTPPPITGIYEPQNILAIPGLNEFLPLTFAVIFAFIITLAVHEGGHGILSRIEGMKVKSTGLLFFVIPIGAFVEPDEKDIEEAKPSSRIRMFGAGITNNLVMAAVSFIIVILLMGLAVPTGTPYISAIYKDYPAYDAGVLPDSLILEINGVVVNSRDEVAAMADLTLPNDTLTMKVSNMGEVSDHSLTLTTWPESFNTNKTSGFMGISYYDGHVIKNFFDTYIASPIGPMLMIYVPINAVMNSNSMGLGFLAFDSPETVTWDVPFPYFWQIVQVFFWLFWLNFAVATFNALPFVPLDGGYIMQEGVKQTFSKRNIPQKYANFVVSFVSWFMILVLAMILLVPYILR